eukprot:m.226240 g.226240  ORF g.226240 m.226240 type:complete len:295 (+) comp26399_c0_seq4:1246-2130(+)
MTFIVVAGQAAFPLWGAKARGWKIADWILEGGLVLLLLNVLTTSCAIWTGWFAFFVEVPVSIQRLVFRAQNLTTLLSNILNTNRCRRKFRNQKKPSDDGEENAESDLARLKEMLYAWLETKIFVENHDNSFDYNQFSGFVAVAIATFLYLILNDLLLFVILTENGINSSDIRDDTVISGLYVACVATVLVFAASLRYLGLYADILGWKETQLKLLRWEQMRCDDSQRDAEESEAVVELLETLQKDVEELSVPPKVFGIAYRKEFVLGLKGYFATAMVGMVAIAYQRLPGSTFTS